MIRSYFAPNNNVKEARFSRQTVSYPLLNPAKMHIQLVEVFQKRAERGAFRHLGEGIHILGEALAAVA